MNNLKNPYNIQIKEYKMGYDYTFIITGGKAHIGATSVAYWENDNLIVKMFELPHHKEGELSKECALSAANKLKCTVTVTVGIHIDNATKEQIAEIVTYVKKAIDNSIHNIVKKQLHQR